MHRSANQLHKNWTLNQTTNCWHSYCSKEVWVVFLASFEATHTACVSSKRAHRTIFSSQRCAFPCPSSALSLWWASQKVHVQPTCRCHPLITSSQTPLVWVSADFDWVSNRQQCQCQDCLSFSWGWLWCAALKAATDSSWPSRSGLVLSSPSWRSCELLAAKVWLVPQAPFRGSHFDYDDWEYHLSHSCSSCLETGLDFSIVWLMHIYGFGEFAYQPIVTYSLEFSSH